MDGDSCDDEFVLGSVFVAVYSILGGAPFDADAVTTSARRVRERLDGDEREQTFVSAMERLVRGDFTEAASVLDAWSRTRRDFAAVRIAHDIYLHVGDNANRLASTTAALRNWSSVDRGSSYVMGMHAFSLEETGSYELAERVGRQALEVDPHDLWARHAIVHVHESRNELADAIRFLDDAADIWTGQDSLSVHLWWHLALRHIAVGDLDAALGVHDRTLDDATTPFRLCDLTSLLWRLELAGGDVGGRWATLADRWIAAPERHTCAFLDVHAAMALTAADHPDAETWHASLATAWEDADCENAEIFRSVVRPLVTAFRATGGDRTIAGTNTTATTIDRLAGRVHRIGGSNAQREVIALTRDARRRS